MSFWFNDLVELWHMDGSGFAVWLCYLLFLMCVALFMIPAVRQWLKDNREQKLSGKENA